MSEPSDIAAAERIVAAITGDTPRMMRLLLRVTRRDRWPWKTRKRWIDLIRHMERCPGERSDD